MNKMEEKEHGNSEKPKGMEVKKEQELQNFLAEAFPQNTRSSLKSFLSNRKVHVNGKPITQFNHLLKIGDRVDIVKQVIKKKILLKGLDIIYEDQYIIVIDKEAGMLSIAGQNKEEETAFRILSQHIKETDEQNRLFVIHRLDKDTSGVMMYAKSQEVQELFQKDWKSYVKERSYITVVEGEIEEEKGTISSYLTEGKTFMMYSSFEDNGGQLAVLNYRRLKYTKHFSMLEVNLETGKKNQIRVQMHAIGHPVAGDRKYGAKSSLIRRVALHAKTLTFIHPITKKEMRFDVQVPKSFYQLLNVK